jgi:hypothetical protein
LPSLAIIVVYENSSLWDFEHLILWWRHVGLMARGSIVLLVSVSRVIFVGVAMDFSAGLCHVVCHQRILGWRSPGCELLFFGFLRIRYEIRCQDAHHSYQPPEL